MYIGQDMYYKNNMLKGHIFLRDSPSDNEIILTQDISVLKEYPNAVLLGKYLGVPQEVGLYELFSMFFDGKVQDDLDMVEALMNGFVFDTDWTFCLKLGVTFCWFKIDEHGLHKLGTMQFSELESRYTVGRFFKRLRYKMAKGGVSLNKVKYLVWNNDDVNENFSYYILAYDCLESFFSRIEGMKGLSVEGVMHFHATERRPRYPALSILISSISSSCLSDSFISLGLYQKDGVLYSRNTYYKDYSSCISHLVDFNKCQYGIILDCEGLEGGDVEAGCSKIGGMIYCKYQDILVSSSVFACDELLIGDTLLQVLEDYKNYTGGLRKAKVIVYGASDKKMLTGALNKYNKKMRRSILPNLDFIDCALFVQDSLKELDLSYSGRGTLSNIARALNVMPVFPKHEPLNDAKTLFNILACILYRLNKFVV